MSVQRSHHNSSQRSGFRNVFWVAAFGVVLLTCRPAGAQHASGYEMPTYTGSAFGTIITGQDGFYIPVADSQDGLVYTYAGNSLGLPQNPNGDAQFVGVTGGDTALPVPFARAQRDMTYGNGTGIWTASFDIAVTYVGQLPSADNIGSFSTALFASPPDPAQQTFIALARWTNPATATNWNADYVWFDNTGTQLIETVSNPGFQNLLTNHWYRWCTVFNLDTNQILEVSITDLTSGQTASQVPLGRYMYGGTTGSATGPPSGFRYFAGTSTAGAAGNTVGFDNLDVAAGQQSCTTGAPCPWDDCGDGNGTVGILDLLALLSNWGPCAGCQCDFNGDGVGILDLLSLMANWGPCP